MSLPLPMLPARPTPGVRDDPDPTASARAAGLGEIVRDLLPILRRRAPHLSETALLDAAERIAAHRLADEELAHRSW